MPLIYRAMLAGTEGPMVGPDARMLGVRVPTDISVDEQGRVHPQTGGMSVAPRLGDLPPHRIPRRLRGLPGLASAVGASNMHVWRMGAGPFVDSVVTANLWLRIDPTDVRHGLIEPAAIMKLEAYSEALSATRLLWEIYEEQA